MPILVRLVLIVLIIYLIGRLLRYAFPYLLKWWVTRMLKRTNPEAYEEMKRQQKQQKGKPGDIHVTGNPGKKKAGENGGDKGEYVDFEEL